jgi:hypothetical protein
MELKHIATPPTQRYGGDVPTVGRRQCHSSGMGSGELPKAAQESSLASPSGHQSFTTLTTVKLHNEDRLRSPVCVYRRPYM